MQETRRKPPPDGGWGWMVALGFFGSTFVMVGIAKSFGIMLPELVTYFDTNVAMVAGVMGVEGVVFTIAAPFCLAFGQHYSQRAVVISGGIVGGIGVSLSYFMLSIEYIICTFGIATGFANACLFGNGLVIIGQYFEKRRSMATALALTGASVGHFVVPPILQLLMDNFGLHGAFLVLGGFYFNVILFGSLYRPLGMVHLNTKLESENEVMLPDRPDEDSPRQRFLKDPADFSQSHHTLHTLPDKLKKPRLSLSTNDITFDVSKLDVSKKRKQFAHLYTARSQMMGSAESLGYSMMAAKPESDDINVTADGERPTRRKFVFPRIFFWQVFKMPLVIIFTIVMFLAFYGYFSFVLFMPSDVVSRGIEKYEKTLLVSLSGIGDFVGRLIIGGIGDLGLMKRYKIMSLVCVLCGLNVIMFDFADSFWWMATHVFLYGVFGGAFVAINAVVLVDLVGLETLPKALSTTLLFQGAGGAIGQPIEGAIHDYTMSYHSINYLNGVSLILGGAVLFCHPLLLRCCVSSPKSPPNKDVPMIVVDAIEEEKEHIEERSE